jgi:signal transduction histidine kinase
MLEKNLHDLGKCKNFVNRISDSSNRSMTLINELLNFSKLSKSGEPFVDVNLNEVLQNIKNDFELTIIEKRAKINHDVLPTIKGIPLQVNQLFDNLLSNSLKFSKKNVKPIITVASWKMSSDEISRHQGLNSGIGYYHISFKDNGIGFAQEYAEQIFTIFQRLHDRQSYTGTGIGLALCKKIVINHHGEIYATSEENGGATFHVILPETQSAEQSGMYS